jgi:16S rRNA (cytosine1402-N4)-methyltransferase
MIATYQHIPVVPERTQELLAPALQGESPILVDATLGLGGHAEAFLTSIPNLRVIGIDRDPEAIASAAVRLEAFGSRVVFVNSRYDELGKVLDELVPGESPQAILFDLGVSSLHLDKPERGFSYSVDAPLDMRMNPGDEVTAAQILASYSRAQLAEIFTRYGDEKLADRYAGAILEAREGGPLTSTSELVAVLHNATPYALRDLRHPAKKVFQALRIEVNRELESLYTALPEALDRLAVDGRIVVLSYHSGEDRFVKKEIRRRSVSGAPLGLPQELPEHRPEFLELTRGAEMASAEEIARNPRATSVRIRAAQKIRKANA